MTKPKLPALTPDEVAALPPGLYTGEIGRIDCHKRVNEPAEFWIRDENDDAVVWTAQQVAECGGITARLVDPAPLEALLQEALHFVEVCAAAGDEEHSSYLCEDIRAALEGNDG